MVLARFSQPVRVGGDFILIFLITSLLQPIALIAGKQWLRLDLWSWSIFLGELVGVGSVCEFGVFERFKCGRNRSIQEMKQLHLQAISVALPLAGLIKVVLRDAVPKPATAQ
ncbi:hypothetical protein ABIB08_007982 [Bradyrhizobium sp. RT11b]